MDVSKTSLQKFLLIHKLENGREHKYLFYSANFTHIHKQTNNELVIFTTGILKLCLHETYFLNHVEETRKITFFIIMYFEKGTEISKT